MPTNPYAQARATIEFCAERNIDPSICLHSKHTPGCPGCARRYLKHHGITLVRWNPDAFMAADVVAAIR